MDVQSRRDQSERFVERLLRRRPEERANYERVLRRPAAEATFEAVPGTGITQRDLALETIVSRERPVLFIQRGQFNTTDVTALGNEAKELVAKLNGARAKLLPLLPLIGRIDVLHFPGATFLGTGWFVSSDIVVTNRHVAKLIAEWDGSKFIFSSLIRNKPLVPSFCNAHEFDTAHDPSRVFKIKDVLYIEPADGKFDIAFVQVERRANGNGPAFIPIAANDVEADDDVCVIGYPARALPDAIPDQTLMQELYRGQYDVKRAAPGLGLRTFDDSSEHDCTTLGGNSGSVVLNLDGQAVGLHFAGLFMEANFAVPASVLRQYIGQKAWTNPRRRPQLPGSPEGRKPLSDLKPKPSSSKSTVTVSKHSVGRSASGTVSVTIPLTITVELGAPVAGRGQAGGNGAFDTASVEEAVKNYWEQKPPDVLAARVGFLDDGEEIGDQPCIAVSVVPNLLRKFESSQPTEFQGVPIRYFPADVEEQLQSKPELESVDSIAYDDDARTDSKFSFDEVEEEMEVILHVGPEYSWIVLKEFLEEAENDLVSAIYEFHAKHIKNVIEKRLEDGASLKLVMDNTTFIKVKDAAKEFNRVKVFEDWAEKFDFERIVAPEGLSGLISDAYHIKVTVRSDNTFWLSSGNWKPGSSQPLITQRQLDNAVNEDLPGNREWHVVIKNKTLARCFKSHILQDFKRAAELGGRELPKSMLLETLVDVPIEEAIVLERKPPSHIIKPKRISRTVKVQPLLTPDKKGAVFAKAVLKLIRSARDSLLFQIPYIAMPANPRQDRGFIDDLLSELVEKLNSLEDARVLLRSQGNKLSSPTHAAWFF